MPAPPAATGPSATGAGYRPIVAMNTGIPRGRRDAYRIGNPYGFTPYKITLRKTVGTLICAARQVNQRLFLLGTPMREIEVGIRYDLKSPPTFFGLDEVNSMLEKGAKIISLQPGGVLARKLGENTETAQLTITGFALKVQLREAGERPEE